MTNHCKICDEMGHTAFYCPKKPLEITTKRYRALKSSGGKYHRKWLKTRKEWFKQNPSEYYECYICHKYLIKEETTLDHVLPRSGRPDLRYELSNLKPCCWPCNTEKGSKRL